MNSICEPLSGGGRTAALLSLEEECSLVTTVLSTQQDTRSVKSRIMVAIPKSLCLLGTGTGWSIGWFLGVLSRQTRIGRRPHRSLGRITLRGVKKFRHLASCDLLIPASFLEPWLPVLLKLYEIRHALTAAPVFQRRTVAERSPSPGMGCSVNQTEGRQLGEGWLPK